MNNESQHVLCLFQTTLDGNVDRDGVVKSTLNPPVRGRFFQINPQEWNEPNKNDSLPDICMRAALFRCGGKYHFLSYCCEAA